MDHEDDEKHANEIRLLIEECQHQITFLRKSQESLNEALLEYPDDSDFLLAVQENSSVIATKEGKIKKLCEVLCRTDAAYREEKRRETIIENRRSAAAINLSIELSDEPDLFPIDDIGAYVPNRDDVSDDSLQIQSSAAIVPLTAPTSSDAVRNRSSLCEDSPPLGLYL